MNSTRLVGAGAVALGIGFNIPYAMLGATYDYPDILRRPAAEALDLFAAGGPSLILTWHGFALAAAALIPLATALAITAERLRTMPALAIAGALTGALSGLVQAMGLWRWVFAVPGLAVAHSAPDSSGDVKLAAEASFDILNAYGGVAIGEQLGQLLLVAFLVCFSLIQGREGRPLMAILAAAAAAPMLFGTGEGLAFALGKSGDIFSLGTIAGFVLLSVWLVMTGFGLMRPARA